MSALEGTALGVTSMESQFRPAFQLVEGYAITGVLASLEMAGFLEELEGQGLRCTITGGLASDEGKLLYASLCYLAQRQLVFEDSGTFKLTETGRAICRDKGYLVWLAGGYGEPLRRLDAFLLGRKKYGTDSSRDGRWVAAGAALLGRRDVVPQAIAMLEKISFNSALDLGCGNARFLVSVCQTFGCRGVGVDISPEACEAAMASVQAAGLTDRVQIIHGDAFAPHTLSELAESELVITFFLLHEISSKGRPALIDFLSRLASQVPTGAHLLAAEVVPPKPGGDQPERFTPEFNFVHALMGQSLSDENDWRRALGEGGFRPKEIIRLDMPGGVLLFGQRMA